jgi:DNA repair ATPase RecN
LKKSASEIFDRILQEKKAKQAEEDRIRKEAEELQKLKDAEEAAKKLQDEIAKMGDLNSTLDNLGNLTDLLKNFKFPNISFDPDSSENKDEDVPPSKEETLEDESPQQEEL